MCKMDKNASEKVNQEVIISDIDDDEAENCSPLDLTIDDIVESDAEKGVKKCGNDGKKVGRKRRNEALEDEESEFKRLLANHQERKRMEKMNKALDDLRKCLPSFLHLNNKRLSKIRTLKLAKNYIATLSDILKEKEEAQQAERTHEQTISYGHYHAYLPTVANVVPSPSVRDFAHLTPQPVLYPWHMPFYDFPGGRGQFYQTPVQTPPRPHVHPRQLDFYTPPQKKMIPFASPTPTPSSCEKNSEGITPTPIRKHFLETPTSARFRRFQLAAMTSPNGSSRNTNELNSSVLSASSEDTKDEVDENPPLKSIEELLTTLVLTQLPPVLHQMPPSSLPQD